MLRGSCVPGSGIVVPLPSSLLGQFRTSPVRGWASSASERGFHLGVGEGSLNICWLYWSLIPFWSSSLPSQFGMTRSFVAAAPKLCLPQPRGAQSHSPGPYSCKKRASIWGFGCVQLLGTPEFVPNPVVSICISLPGELWLQWFPASPLLSGKALAEQHQKRLLQLPERTPRCPQLRVTTRTWEGATGSVWQAGWVPGMGESSRIAPRSGPSPQELLWLCAASFF